MSTFRPIARPRAFEEILEQLEHAIAAGDLEAGDRLPSERELSQLFEVSRPTLREALRVLEALGVVRTLRGAEHGTTILEQPGSSALTSVFRYYIALRHIGVRDLVEFRALIESWAAGTVARKADAEVIAELRKLVATMDQTELEPREFHEIDTAFHIALVRGCDNDLLRVVLEGCRTAIQRVMLEALLESADWTSLRTRLVQEHAAICDALAKQDSELASHLASAHVRTFYEDFVGGATG